MTAVARPRPPRVDLEARRRSLCATEGAPFVAPAWLTDAALDRDAFWREIAPALVAAVAGSSRSSPFERYQLAHDLGARHAVGRSPGFVHHDASGATVTSYARLVEDARALAGAWRARVAPGMCVAIVAPTSPELVTALLATWHLGAVAAPLPVWGLTYLHHRLAALEADFVATSRPRALWLGVASDVWLATAPAVGDGAPPGLAHAYAPDDAVLRVFSPLGDTPLAALDVSAERLYLGALRDGVVFFGLAAELGLAAPGFCDVQFGLPLLVTCLATGGHFVAISLDAACQRPELVCDGTPHILGVHPRLRDAISAAGHAGSGPARWFRSPATAHEPERWARLAEARPFARSLGACYAASPLAGGAITWSAWRRSPALNTALPAPGLDWQLIDPGRGGAASADGNGVLSSTDAPIEAIGQPLLGRIGDESLWVTSLGAHRDGQRLPATEIEAVAVAARSDVWAAALVDDPRLGAVLVVFVRPDRFAGDQPARDALAGELTELLAVQLAPHLAPPRIDVFSVPPRFADDGAIDRDWCRGQHASGRLAAKQREPLFTTLALLRIALTD